VTCVVYMTIAGTRVPLARLLGDTLYWNDMGLVRRGFEHKKETGGLDSGLRRNDIVGAWIPAFAGMTLSGDRLAPCNAEFIRQTWCSTKK